MYSTSTTLWIFFLILLQAVVQGEIFISFTETNQTLGPINTPRYSERIGVFSSSCNISRSATILSPDENPCDQTTFDRNLLNLVVFTTNLRRYGCFEETSFKNLQILGASAIVNTDNRPGGFSMFTSHIGHRKEDTQIPILDTGLNFLEQVFNKLEVDGDEFTVEINNCDDENPHTVCYRVVEPLSYVLLSVVAFFVALSCRRGLINMKKTQGTKPRRIILSLLMFCCFFLFVLSFFNLFSTEGFVWITGGRYKSNLGIFLIALLFSQLFFSTLLCSIYWMFLTYNCFYRLGERPDSSIMKILTFFFKNNFFECTAFYAIVFVSLVVFIVVEVIILQPAFESGDILRLFIILDFIVMLAFAFANYCFNKNVLKTLKLDDKKNKDSLDPNINPSSITRITGLGLCKFISRESSDENETHRGMFLLATHLSVILLLNFILRDSLETYGKSENSAQLRLCTFTLVAPLFLFFRLCLLCCLIKGIIGPKLSSSGILRRDEGVNTMQSTTRVSYQENTTGIFVSLKTGSLANASGISESTSVEKLDMNAGGGYRFSLTPSPSARFAVNVSSPEALQKNRI
eukprot:snap_masked-scaffold_4-processed-gene-10.32-mRNA-1 protein AED:1.00 eAED:1.00 QI:0/0/0/0/1/1/2/0/574